VRGSVERNDLYYQIISRSERRNWKRAVWQQEVGMFHPYVWVEEDTPEEALDLLAEDSDVPVDSWMDLAALFLGHLKDEEKVRFSQDQPD